VEGIRVSREQTSVHHDDRVDIVSVLADGAVRREPASSDPATGGLVNIDGEMLTATEIRKCLRVPRRRQSS